MEVEVAAGFCQGERREDLRLACGGCGPSRDASLRGLHGDEVHAVQLVTDVAPGVAGAVLDDADDQQREPAELDVASDPVLAVVEAPRPLLALEHESER